MSQKLDVVCVCVLHDVYVCMCVCVRVLSSYYIRHTDDVPFLYWQFKKKMTIYVTVGSFFQDPGSYEKHKFWLKL